MSVAPARDKFDERQVGLVKRTIARGCSEEDIALFMELCAFWDLSPFSKMVWIVPTKPRDGGKPGPARIMIGRDGLLALANRQPDFLGLQGDVIRATDHYEMSTEGIIHTYKGTPADRGEIVGAWAVARRQDKSPVHFMAPMSEYKGPSGPWRQYPSSMILKCAQSVVLRLAYSVTGFTPDEETSGASAPAAEEAPITWGDGPLGTWLQELVETSRRVTPDHAPTDGFLRLELSNLSEDGRRLYAHGLVDLILEHGGEPPEPPEGLPEPQ